MTPLVVGFLCGLATFLLLAWANRQLLGSAIIDDGDMAANSILVDRAEGFRLLVGNYSRFGFNHPGPALLYAQAFGDMLFHRLLGIVPASYNGQFLGIIALNAFCIGTACAVIRQVTGRTLAAVALLALIPIVHVWQPFALATTWMPGVYIAPFLLLVVAAASVAGGRWGHLWVLVVGASLCVHGHVAFVLFAGVTTIVAVLAGWLRMRRGGHRPSRSDLILAGVVLAAFLAPIVANLVLHWPGELARYLRVFGSQVGVTPRTAGDVLEFGLSFWIRSGPWILAFLAGAVAIAIIARIVEPADGGARFRLDLVALCGLQMALFIFYAARGVDDLVNTYLGWFMLVCPLLVLWAGLDTLVDTLGRRLERPGRVVGAVGCAALAIVLLAAGQSANPYRGIPVALARAIPSGAVRLAFDTPGWPAALGIVEDARRRGQEICVVDAKWHTIATSALICADDAQGLLIHVLGPGEPRVGSPIYDDGTNAVVGK